MVCAGSQVLWKRQADNVLFKMLSPAVCTPSSRYQAFIVVVSDLSCSLPDCVILQQKGEWQASSLCHLGLNYSLI